METVLSETGLEPRKPRLWFLDWVRVGAFGLLIFYHIGMYYWANEAWHIKAAHQSDSLKYLMWLTNPWRIPLLFLISGAASRFMLDRWGRARFCWRRGLRLGLPILFGMFVVVAPQVYVQSRYEQTLEPGFFPFWLRYVTLDPSLARGLTWNHLWFIVYLLVYTLVVAAIAAPLRELARRIDNRFVLGNGFVVLLLPALLLGAGYAALKTAFPSTHNLLVDWTNHWLFGWTFVLGFIFAGSQRVWTVMAAFRWPALVAAAACYFAVVAPGEIITMPRIFGRFVFELQAWGFIIAVLGFAVRHLDRPHRAVAYLNTAIFPYYIVHQTFIVLLGYAFLQVQLPTPLEVSLMIGLTGVGCAIAYEAVKRVGVLRPLFGLQ